MRQYADRIEVLNSGGLYGRVNRDNFPDENDYRNPIIADAMRTLGYVNRFGRDIGLARRWDASPPCAAHYSGGFRRANRRATRAPLTLCHTLKIAPGTEAIG